MSRVRQSDGHVIHPHGILDGIDDHVYRLIQLDGLGYPFGKGLQNGLVVIQAGKKVFIGDVLEPAADIAKAQKEQWGDDKSGKITPDTV